MSLQPPVLSCEKVLLADAVAYLPWFRKILLQTYYYEGLQAHTQTL